MKQLHFKGLCSSLGRSGLFRRTVSLMVIVLVGMTAVYAQQKELPRIEDYRYEDWFTFKNGKPYIADPYTWVYTREFAQLFRMPEKWIDDKLKGALAVAFRMTTIGVVNCGLGGREHNCLPSLQCQMDVYYDNRTKLPWVREDIMRDLLLRGLSSHEYLYDVSRSKGIRRYLSKGSNGIPRVLASGGVVKVGKFYNLPAQVAYFDREYEPGIGLAGWVGLGVCPKPVGTGHMYFYDQETSERINRMQIKSEDAKPMHVIEFPKSFMRRANAAYERDNKPNTNATERLMREFLESRQPSTKP